MGKKLSTLSCYGTNAIDVNLVDNAPNTTNTTNITNITSTTIETTETIATTDTTTDTTTTIEQNNIEPSDARMRGIKKMIQKETLIDDKFNKTMSIAELKEELMKASFDSVPEFNLNEYKGLCKVIKVYDGDTVYIALELFSRIYKIKCRLSGIDTAEIKSTDSLEEQIAIKTRTRVEELTNNRLLWVVIHTNDKYGGRYVASIYMDSSENENKTINNILLSEGLAYSYDGRTKKIPFRDWYSFSET